MQVPGRVPRGGASVREVPPRAGPHPLGIPRVLPARKLHLQSQTLGEQPVQTAVLLQQWMVSRLISTMEVKISRLCVHHSNGSTENLLILTFLITYIDFSSQVFCTMCHF